MEKLFFRKIELWVVALVLVLSFFGTIMFGAIVLDEERGNEEQGGDHFGVVGDVALALAEVPENARQTFKKIGRPDQTMVAWLSQETDLESGWSWVQSPGAGGLDGFLLLSRHDGNQTRHVIELISLKSGEAIRTWTPESETLLSGVARRPEFDGKADYAHWNNAYFRFIHPYLTEAGDLLLKDHDSPLFLLSACGDVRWVQDETLFHHSTESDGEGGFWIPSYILDSDPASDRVSPRLSQDALTRVNADGEVIFEESLVDIFKNNGLRHLIFPAANFYHDPLHLNKIEPVLTSGRHWEKGDLFLSFRSPSLVMQYRPSTGKVIWSQAGPWMAQHDVDVIDDHKIAVFNNNAYDSGLGTRVFGVSEPVIYDFDTGSLESPYRDVLEKFEIATVTEGLQDFTPTGHVILEEENRGRVFIFDAAGEIVATFVNRGENGEIYRMGWSRYISQSHGEKALEAIARSGC